MQRKLSRMVLAAHLLGCRRMRRFLVPGVPFLLSLTLSLCTIGSSVGWQDSGFYLAAVQDLGVLYPPGFALYIVLCKTWTLLLGLLDFTLAVHLFSSLCCALAAATLALAARDLLRSRGPLSLGAPPSDAAAIAAGCLAASGFTFWSAALLAKGYALYYLVLSLLLWRLIRADDSGKPRDFTLVAALIGLAWAAHPSAVGIGVALLLFVWLHRRALSIKGFAVRAGLAAACAVGPSLILPALAARNPAPMFGDPTTPGEWFRYLAGARFTGRAGVFGIDEFRFGSAVRDGWEEFLGIGAVLALWGLARLAVVNRKLLVGIAAWTLPSALLAILFRIEGQLDFWLVASWLPLYLAVALGLASIPARYARPAIPAVAVLGLVWATAANGRAVSTRHDTLAESFGRFHLERVDPDAILMLESDDALSTTLWLQIVKGVRPDVVVVSPSRLGQAWYDRHLGLRHPGLKAAATPSAFALTNAPGHPVYFEQPPADLDLVPAGPYMKVTRPGEPEPAAWSFPVRPEEARARFGRERGIRLRILPDRLEVEPEPYEQRWVSAFVRAESQRGSYYFRKAGDDNLRKAADCFEAARAADLEHPDRDVVHGLAVSFYLLKRYDRAEPLLKQLLRL